MRLTSGWRRVGPLRVIAPLGVAALVVLPFATRPALVGGDEPHYALIAHSLAADRDLVLEDDYLEVAAGAPWAGRKRAGENLDRHLRSVNGVEISTHPVGWPAIAAPWLALQQAVSPRARQAPPDLLLVGLTLALTGAAIAAAWRTWTAPDARAILLATFFTTPLWFYGRTFFTEPATVAFLVLGVAALSCRRDWAAALALTAALATKETALLAVLPIALAAVIWEARHSSGWRSALRRAAILASGLALYVAAFILKSRATTGEWWTPGQEFAIGDPLSGALGLLVDPRHSLVPFAPLLAIGAAGWFLRPRDADDRLLGWTSAAIFLAYFAITAAWTDWRGGACYGPRLLLPALPALAVPTLRLRRSGHRIARAALVVAAVLGFTLQFRAAMDPVEAFWSASVGQLLLEDAWKTVVVALGAAAVVWKMRGLVGSTA